MADSRKVNNLLYYSFDWDDNILSMDTKLRCQELIDSQWVEKYISTVEFAECRALPNFRLYENDPSLGFSEFRDYGIRGDSAFILDTIEAIQAKRFAPSWNDFIECLVNGCLFSIITARGHQPQTLRKAVEYILDNVLTSEQLYEMYNNLLKFDYLFNTNFREKYFIGKIPSKDQLVVKFLDRCEFIPVTCPELITNEPIEEVKKKSLLNFSQRVHSFGKRVGMGVKIGFSDDDNANIEKIQDLVNSLCHEEFSNLESFVVKATKNPLNILKTVKRFTIVEKQKITIIV